MKTILKKSDLLVEVSRFFRRIPNLWNQIYRERQDETHKSFEVIHDSHLIHQYLNNKTIHKLQIGCGENLLPGWLNSDLEPTQEGVIFLDAQVIFPFESGTFDYIFSEHMIEHIPYKGGLYMVKECFRILKPGGKIRIATPDIIKIVKLFDKQKTEEQKKYLLWSVFESIGLYGEEKTQLQKHHNEWDIDRSHIKSHHTDPVNDSVCFVVNNFFHSYGHKFLYDEVTLQGILLEAGFNRIERFSPGQSNDQHLSGLESHGRLIGDEINFYESMIIEAVKPG